jgi:hypothetical protein
MSYGNVQANKILNGEYLPLSLLIILHGIIQHIAACESAMVKEAHHLEIADTSLIKCMSKMSHVARSPTTVGSDTLLPSTHVAALESNASKKPRSDVILLEKSLS